MRGSILDIKAGMSSKSMCQKLHLQTLYADPPLVLGPNIGVKQYHWIVPGSGNLPKVAEIYRCQLRSSSPQVKSACKCLHVVSCPDLYKQTGSHAFNHQQLEVHLL